MMLDGYEYYCIFLAILIVDKADLELQRAEWLISQCPKAAREQTMQVSKKIVAREQTMQVWKKIVASSRWDQEGKGQ